MPRLRSRRNPTRNGIRYRVVPLMWPVELGPVLREVALEESHGGVSTWLRAGVLEQLRRRGRLPAEWLARELEQAQAELARKSAP